MLNKFTELLNDPYADKIQIDTADYMLDKNKNKLLHLLDLENVIDVNMIHYMKSGEPIDFEECETNAHSFLNMKYYKKTDVNTVIPILKHVDRCRRYTKILKDIIEKRSDYFKVINRKNKKYYQIKYI